MYHLLLQRDCLSRFPSVGGETACQDLAPSSMCGVVLPFFPPLVVMFALSFAMSTYEAQS